MTTVQVRGCVAMGSGVPVRGERIKERRLVARLSQEDAAAKAGVDVSYWSQLENNKVMNPGLRTIQRVAAAIGTSMSYILGETDDPDPIRLLQEAPHDQTTMYDDHLPPHPDDILDLERTVREANEILKRMRRQQGRRD